MDERLRKGERAVAEGRLDEAKALFQEVLAACPTEPQALNDLGVIAHLQEEYEEAVSCFQRALCIIPNDVEATENLALCLADMGEYSRAIKVFQKAMDMGVMNAGLLNAMAQCAIRLGDPELAGSCLKESLEMDPGQDHIRRRLEAMEPPSRPKGAAPAFERRLRIGFISAWFERGQAYVTKTIRDALHRRHETHVLARTGRVYGVPMLESKGFWDVPNLTTHPDQKLPLRVVEEWIRDRRLDMVIFNEEYDWDLVQCCKRQGVRVLTYLDYYQYGWRDLMAVYDAVLCSTRRTFELVKGFCNAHYIGWAVDSELFRPQENGERKHTFFHNAGWLGVNYRKMTPVTVVAFEAVSRHMPDVSLLVHAQAEMERLPHEVVQIVRRNPKITYHVATLPAPGLYHKAAILVFPSKLEGLGLPLLEGMACGLPAIATDAPPMNEFVRDHENGLLVPVSVAVPRDDAIAFPEALVSVNDLAVKMAQLAQDPSLVRRMGKQAREFIVGEMDMDRFAGRLSDVIGSLF